MPLSPTVSVRRIPAHRTWELRQRVLRPHQRIEEMNYFGDHDAETAHFGAFIGEELLSIGSLYLAPLNSPHAKQQSAAHTWQLRGMATSPQHAGQGLGAAVLQAAISHASTQGGKLLWCNAREGALGFYQKFAFSSISNTFDLPGIGPHQVMIRILT